jgi:hypothetical protein
MTWWAHLPERQPEEGLGFWPHVEESLVEEGPAEGREREIEVILYW